MALYSAPRTLRPHVEEQPFAIPGNVAAVTIRARDSVHGHGGRGPCRANDLRRRRPTEFRYSATRRTG